MIDYIQAHPGGLLLLCIAAIAFIRIVNSPDNDLEWWHYIASKGEDGKQYADLNKLIKVIGAGIGSWVVVVDSYEGKADDWLLCVYLGFCAGSDGFSAWLRARQDK